MIVDNLHKESGQYYQDWTPYYYSNFTSLSFDFKVFCDKPHLEFILK